MRIKGQLIFSHVESKVFISSKYLEKFQVINTIISNSQNPYNSKIDKLTNQIFYLTEKTLNFEFNFFIFILKLVFKVKL